MYLLQLHLLSHLWAQLSRSRYGAGFKLSAAASSVDGVSGFHVLTDVTTAWQVSTFSVNYTLIIKFF